MIKVDVVVSVARDGFYSVYCKDCPALFGGGDSVESAVDELQDTLRMTRDEIGKESARFYPEWLDGEYEFVMNYPKQLWAYQHGRSKPCRKQIEKIESALHKLGRELSQVTFC